MTPKNNKSRVALITGGVGGIGTGISMALAKAGHTVIANYAIEGTDTPWLAAMGAEGLVDRAHVAFGDVTNYDAMISMVNSIIDQHGPIGILVNCAGITRDASFRKMSKAQWDAVMSTNLDSVFNVTKPVIESMCNAGWGRIVNISSINGTRGQFGQTNYAAAKAGLLGFTKSLAYEVAKQGVTVNAVSPGYIDTVMTQAIKDEFKQQLLTTIPAGRPGTPDDIGAAVAFLCSEEASYITGTNLSVNGGIHMYQ